MFFKKKKKEDLIVLTVSASLIYSLTYTFQLENFLYSRCSYSWPQIFPMYGICLFQYEITYTVCNILYILLYADLYTIFTIHTGYGYADHERFHPIAEPTTKSALYQFLISFFEFMPGYYSAGHGGYQTGGVYLWRGLIR